MTTATAFDLTPLRQRVLDLLGADRQPALEAFNRLRMEDPDYRGPDPRPHIAAITQRLVGRDIDVRVDSPEFDKRGFGATVWGFTMPAGVSPDFPRTTVLIREGMPPRGALLTLAHEGGHALTTKTPTPVEQVMMMFTYAMVGGHPQEEVLAEVTAYLVGAATGVMPDPTLSANYIVGWLGAAEMLRMDAAEVWARQADRAQHAAATLLGIPA